MKRPRVMMLLAGALTLSMALPSALPTTAGTVKVVQAAEKKTEDVSEKTDSSIQEQKDKTETVYVDANADGSVKKITVKDWLRRNGDGAILDFSNLKEIKNTEGDEEYTQNADGTITWENKGEDISYEGTADLQLPVTTKVTYYLDGNEIKPENLAGKSGKVKIRFDYINNESRIVNIDGKEIEVKVPFLAAPVLMLPGDKFKNVQVSGGKVMADQDQSIVIGTAFPGLSDSLKLGDYEATKDIDLKDYVEVTADVENFALDFTATAISTCGLSDMEDDNLDDLDDMIEGVKKMKEASGELVDAMGQLSIGAGTLGQYLGQYVGGVSQTDAGVQALASGLKELETQVNTVMAGLGTTDDTSDLTTQIQKDLEILQQELENVSTLAGYADAVEDNIQTAKNTLETINLSEVENELEKSASDQAKEKVDEAVDLAVDQTASKIAESTAEKTAAQAIQNFQNSSVYKNLSPEQQEEMLKAVQTASENAATTAKETNYTAIKDQIKENAKNIDYKTIKVTSPITGAQDSIKSALENLTKASGKNVDISKSQTALTDLITKFQALSTSLADVPDLSDVGAKLQTAISQLAQGATVLENGTNQLNIAGTQLNTSMTTLAQSTNLLTAGMKTFDKEGIQELSNLAGDNLADVTERFKAVKEAEKTYTNYGGIKEGTSGSVKFIVETKEIK